MSDTPNIPPSPSQPRTPRREIQTVEEDVNTDNANSPAAFQHAATSILGHPNFGAAARTTPVFGMGSHPGKKSIFTSHFFDLRTFSPSHPLGMACAIIILALAFTPCEVQALKLNQSMTLNDVVSRPFSDGLAFGLDRANPSRRAC
jgi:hypothetical protein